MRGVELSGKCFCPSRPPQRSGNHEQRGTAWLPVTTRRACGARWPGGRLFGPWTAPSRWTAPGGDSRHGGEAVPLHCDGTAWPQPKRRPTACTRARSTSRLARCLGGQDSTRAGNEFDDRHRRVPHMAPAVVLLAAVGKWKRPLGKKPYCNAGPSNGQWAGLNGPRNSPEIRGVSCGEINPSGTAPCLASAGASGVFARNASTFAPRLSSSK